MNRRDPTLRSDVTWRFDAAVDEVWAAMGDLDRYRGWWPWLRCFDADGGLAAGATWRCVVTPPLRYRVGFEVRLTDVDPARLVRAALAGDIEGTAELRLRGGDSHGPGAASTDVHLASELRPTGRTLRALSRVAPPLARHGHDVILRHGADQFRARALDPPPG